MSVLFLILSVVAGILFIAAALTENYRPLVGVAGALLAVAVIALQVGVR